jgi:hypothetical protein
MSDANRDDEIVEIAPYLMKALVARYFFEKLDDKLCPVQQSEPREACAGDYAISETLLRGCSFHDNDLEDI